MACSRRTHELLETASRGRLVREGLRIVIAGPPNVGKSRLFNALVGSARTIVTDVAGTTRDLVSEVVDVNGLRVTLVDTAGLRDTDDRVEAEGVARTRGAAARPIWCCWWPMDRGPMAKQSSHVCSPACHSRAGR